MKLIARYHCFDKGDSLYHYISSKDRQIRISEFLNSLYVERYLVKTQITLYTISNNLLQYGWFLIPGTKYYIMNIGEYVIMHIHTRLLKKIYYENCC